MASLEEILRSAGFSGQSLRTAMAVVMAESGGNSGAYNGKGNDNSYGLFQINMIGGMGPERRKKYGLSSNDDLFDPYTNARVAFALSNGGTKWSPWTTYTSGKYKRYLGQSGNVQLGDEGGGAYSVAGGQEKKLDMDTLASMYGYSVAFFKSDKKLWDLINEAVKAQWTPEEFGARLKNTAWYKKNSQSVREWYALERVDSATASLKLAQTQARLAQLASQQGITMDPKRLKDMAWRVNAYGWDENQVASALAAEMKYDPKKAPDYYGGLAVKHSKIMEEAAAYGVDISEASAFNLMRDLVGEKSTEEAVTEYIKKMAKSRYLGLADDIDRGMTVADVAQPFIEAQSRLLELNPADVHLMDPMVQRALQYRDPKTGVPAPMTVFDFETSVKKDPRWLQTKNARDAMLGGARQILADWGMQ